MRIRAARPGEREAHEDLQRRASIEGPLFRERLLAHPEAIDLPAEHIASGLVRVAERDARIVGFSVLLDRVDDACELDGLFVEPDQMRAGVGRALIDDAVRIARECGALRIEVDASPQALAFYGAVGFVTTGEARTRFGNAPRMTLDIAQPP
jgi:GNAT superfamily N-acetyltransferase